MTRPGWKCEETLQFTPRHWQSAHTVPLCCCATDLAHKAAFLLSIQQYANPCESTNLYTVELTYELLQYEKAGRTSEELPQRQTC